MKTTKKMFYFMVPELGTWIVCANSEEDARWAWSITGGSLKDASEAAITEIEFGANGVSMNLLTKPQSA